MSATNLIYLNDFEVKAILAEASASGGDARDKAILSLFLHTGVLVQELCDLTISSIDWKTKILRVQSKRTREIPLNDEALSALTEWSKERPDSHSDAFFVTARGEINKLTARNVDHLIKKYAERAGIKFTVNAHVLRSTFAVRLIKQEVSLDRVLKLLGLKSAKGIQPYALAAKGEATPDQDDVEHLDSRPKIVRQISKLLPKKPKEAVVLAKVSDAERSGTIGRDGIIEKIKHDLKQGVSILLVSDLGVGKSHLLKHIAKENDYIYLISPSPSKDLLTALCNKYCPDWVEKLPKGKRASVREITEHVTQTIKELHGKPVLVIDNLDNLRRSDIELFQLLMDKFTILAATEKMAERLKPIWWKFTKINLEPMSDEAIHALIEHLSKDLTVQNREMLATQVSTHASGSPLAVVEMIHQIRQMPRVREDDIRNLHHEAGVRYVECANLIILFWAGALVYRFIALGTHSFENYILAGFLTTITMVSRLLLRKVK